MSAELITMDAELQLQERLLPGVSRTFALTIPQLPGQLREAVTNAYLLCRIADTIEDDPDLPVADKQAFHAEFVAVVCGEADPLALSRRLGSALGAGTPREERELIAELPAVVRITRALPEIPQRALVRCVSIMCTGMPRFQRETSIRGLSGLEDLERYCYYVAGVVGEMLTELFCHHNRALGQRRDELMRLAVSFGQGLQMTNILKDFWADRRRNMCWLPRSVFEAHGVDLAVADQAVGRPPFRMGMTRLVAIAHACLRDAMGYVRLIPRSEPGIRRFCLWAIGLAVLTLRNIRQRPDFTDASEIKVSRAWLRVTIITANVLSRSNAMISAAFSLAASGLPLVSYRTASPLPVRHGEGDGEAR